MQESLSEEDIKKAFHGKIKVLAYRELLNYKTVEKLLEPYGYVVIHYPDNEEESNGHWAALLYSVDDKGKKVIEFFDPYGCQVDEAFQMMGVISRPLLSNLLLKTKYPVHYNDVPLQTQHPLINTCGRHVVLRIMNRDMSINRYASELLRFNPDEIVTFLIKT